MILLAENAVLIVSALSDNWLEGGKYGEKGEFRLVLDLYQAVVLITLDNRLADALLEKGSIGEDELTAFELCRVRWEEMLHEPLEFLSAYAVRILLDEGLHGVDYALKIFESTVLDLKSACSAINLAWEASLGAMNFKQLITVDIVGSIDSWWPAVEIWGASYRTFLIKAIHALAEGILARHTTLDFDRVAFWIHLDVRCNLFKFI